MKNIFLSFLLLFCLNSFSQTNTQVKFSSDNRVFYTWDNGNQAYKVKEKEFEHSVIEIRQIGSKTNGYILLALNDNGIVRTYHGSISDYNETEDGEYTWNIHSKNMLGKVVYNQKKKTIIYSFDSNEKRFKKIFVFNLTEADAGEE